MNVAHTHTSLSLSGLSLIPSYVRFGSILFLLSRPDSPSCYQPAIYNYFNLNGYNCEFFTAGRLAGGFHIEACVVLQAIRASLYTPAVA
ncbi:MAG: hypothetical protein H6Q14_2114 [Bacteroidetes bacterium]|nr:hypothetical protein [Bacteroidota bacterium]